MNLYAARGSLSSTERCGVCAADRRSSLYYFGFPGEGYLIAVSVMTETLVDPDNRNQHECAAGMEQLNRSTYLSLLRRLFEKGEGKMKGEVDY